MFKCVLTEKGRYHNHYDVFNINGMTDEQVLDACDRNNFGGVVVRDYNGNGTAMVYID